jgi:uncharacterized protein with GYD domain
MALRSPRSLEEIATAVTKQIEADCPTVRWTASYAVLGPYDYVDVFQAPDVDTAMRVAALVRSFGHANTEVWPATPWSDFKKLIRDLPGPEGLLQG